MEKAAEYSRAGYVDRFLAMVKANAGEVREARTIFAKSAETLPQSMKNVTYFLSVWPFKDLQVLQNIAEGYVKAGLPGAPSDFYKISRDNRLTGDEIRKLFFGRKVTGVTPVSKKQWWIERDKDVQAAIVDGDTSDNGKSWIEDDMLCNQWDNLYEGLKDCWVVYRNPEGAADKYNEYFGAPGYGIYPFSTAK